MRGIARAAGYRCPMVDLATLPSRSRKSLDATMLALAHEIHNQDPHGPTPEDLWQSNLSASTNFTSILERILLRGDASRSVLFIENADRALALDFAQDFSDLLRFLVNQQAASTEWRRFHLFLSVSLAPHLSIEKINSSDFNVGREIRLREFTLEQVRWLNGRHAPRSATEEEVVRLHEWTGGHPYLTRRALFWLSEHSSCTFDDLKELAESPSGPFREVTDWILARLDEKRDLESSLLEVLESKRCSKSRNFRRLTTAGLVAGSRREARLRYPAFEDLLRPAL